MDLTVITATIGSKHLEACMDSVDQHDVNHLIVFDGEHHVNEWHGAVDFYNSFNGKRQFIVLPFNTGQGGHYGHRIYASMSLLVNTKYVAFLDDDCTLQPNYKAVVEQAIKSKKDVYAFDRNIMLENGEILGIDTRESIGKNEFGYYLHDINCYVVKSSYMRVLVPFFFMGFGTDRILAQFLHTKAVDNFKYINDPIVNYRVREDKLEFYRRCV